MDINYYFVYVLIGLSNIFTAVQTKRLDDYITHYEGLHYDTDTLHQRHLRYRRSNTQRHLVFKFKAFNRDFDLELVPDDSIFTPDFSQQYNNGSTYPADISFIYRGKVKGDPASYVHGSVLEGVFRGFIVTNRDTIYHLEHVRRFFPAGHSVPYHSVIYKSDHVNLDPYRHRRAAGEGACGLEKHRQWMEQKSTPEDSNQKSSKYSEYANNDRSDSQGATHHDGEDGITPGHTWEGSQNFLQNGQGHRARRNAPSSKSTNRLGARNTCYMYLRSDPIMWRYIKKQGMDDSVAKNEILAMFANHVAAINEIYKPTNFTTYPYQPTDYYYIGVQFRVQRTSVMTDQTENCNTTKASQFCNPDIDVSNFLDLTSRENHDQFCLAFTFTARDFSGGTLGLAWVASPENSAGGICEKYKSFPEDDGQVVSKSLNTGIVTIINYGKRVAPTVSHLTFAHEVGHNFGSPHDTGICAPYNTHYPGASAGNYIMYASATHGDLPHNHEFSVCSKDNMTRVLHSLLEGRFKKNCLQNQEGSFCGNGIREEGEECDCGYVDDCDEKCCNPRHEKKRDSDCKLKPSYQCSPSQGPCCTSECEFITASINKTCRAATDCIYSSRCPGDSAECPSPRDKPDIETLCNDKLSVCQKGECTGSLCKKVGYTNHGHESSWVECESSSPQCFLSCRYNGTNNTTDTCISSSSIPQGSKYDDYRNLVNSIKGPDSKVPLPAGSPCDDFKGYCDVFSRCRTVNNNGPLARLQNLIFGNETWTMIREWIVENWWIVMLIAMALVIFMLIFIKVCGVNTPSFDPKLKPVSKVTPTSPQPKGRDSNQKQARRPRDQYLDAYDRSPRQPRASHDQNHPREFYHMGNRQRY
ncbi:disintegrin and metalloproteinase domain-containing protein 10-like isoform X2 [Pecten maximus]|uniref:disintegrin and metalloproteinase domain-containing protein 10-like isoform X1 n=1 Tax=Pecten maximus TaxID=6579 RepID=UPI0014588516|nr:disintegrin and metalloproteinase domain-containing protein 10-like isoform X1 [Pecten maximus]XP_033725850.1 disintegrin and metalloproteinase domain-containing protein 10-like isoform X2 [Pecten maximus]